MPEDRTTSPLRLSLALTALLLTIVLANALTSQLGLVTWLGLTATAGTWVAGFALLFRDLVHDYGGPRWVLLAIVLGVPLSALLSPRLALASAVAFLLAELADYAVYAPLLRRGRYRAALASNLVGALVDTVVFLLIAGFPLTGTDTQVSVKLGTTSLVVLALAAWGWWWRRAVSRQPLRA
jgi:queuosine precursor transporter